MSFAVKSRSHYLSLQSMTNAIFTQQLYDHAINLDIFNDNPTPHLSNVLKKPVIQLEIRAILYYEFSERQTGKNISSAVKEDMKVAPLPN